MTTEYATMLLTDEAWEECLRWERLRAELATAGGTLAEVNVALQQHGDPQMETVFGYDGAVGSIGAGMRAALELGPVTPIVGGRYRLNGGRPGEQEVRVLAEGLKRADGEPTWEIEGFPRVGDRLEITRRGMTELRARRVA